MLVKLLPAALAEIRRLRENTHWMNVRGTIIDKLEKSFNEQEAIIASLKAACRKLAGERDEWYAAWHKHRIEELGTIKTLRKQRDEARRLATKADKYFGSRTTDDTFPAQLKAAVQKWSKENGP
jgi:hypothetical protein